MQAVITPEFGSPEVLKLGEVDRPRPGEGEVLVRIIASGTNPVDAKLRQDGSWAGLEPPVVLGYDAAGIVEETGPGARRFSPGDEVFYTPEILGNARGTYAEYNVVDERIVAPKPDGLTFEEAAAIPLAGGTAWEAVSRRLLVTEGETVLLHGAAGGVGHFALQFAKVAGARVIATAGASHQAALGELGADLALDYEADDVTEAVLEATDGKGADAAFDIAGEGIVSRSLPALRPHGRIACILAPEGDLAPLYQKNLTLHGIFLTRESERLEEMRPLLESGAVKPWIDRVLPLAEVAAAHERLDSGHGLGKIVLDIAQA